MQRGSVRSFLVRLSTLVRRSMPCADQPSQVAASDGRPCDHVNTGEHILWTCGSMPLREEMNRVDGTQHTVSRAAQSLTDVRMPKTKLALSNNTGKVVVGIYLRHNADVLVIGHCSSAQMMTLHSHI